MYQGKRIGIIIPYYRHAKHIGRVVRQIPAFIDRVIIVDDHSPEPLPPIHRKNVQILRHSKNQGVGGATVSGFKQILQTHPHIVVKMDADDQMDLDDLPAFLDPLILGRAELSKGNRFYDFNSLKTMPLNRRLGNFFLSFLTKAATGYWKNFDPTNGFLAIKAEYLDKINLDALHPRFYFETSLQAEAYFHRIRIMDIPIKSRYHAKSSNLRIGRELLRYPVRLTRTFLKRILRKYFLYDFCMASIYILLGIPLLGFGLVFGLGTWVKNAGRGVLTPTGTIMLITLSIILGFQFLLEAIHMDIDQAPSPE